MPKTTYKKKPNKLVSFLTGRGKMLVVILLIAIGGTAAVLVSHAGTGLRVAIVGDATGKGYWVAASDGGVFSVGDAPFYGSKGGTALPAPIVGMAATADKKGYWLVDSLGNIYNFGDAPFDGSLPHNFPSAGVRDIVGMAADPATNGYWLVGADGGVFNFGAPLHGSEGGKIPANNVVGIASTADGGGYWLVGADGGVFALGNAPFLGSMGGKALSSPVSGIARQGGTNNYWLTAKDGGIFSFGAPFYGSMSGHSLAGPVLGMTSSPDGKGYWLVGSDGGVFSFGDAVFQGTAPQINPATATVTTTTPNPICTSVDVSVSGRTVTIGGLGVNAYSAPYRNTVINWGDGSAQVTVANAVGQSHAYAYGSFTLTVTPHYTVNGADYAASSSACSHAVSFSQPPAPVAHTPAPSGSAVAVNVDPTTVPGYGDGCGGDAKLTADGGGCTCNNGITIYYDGPMPNSTNNPGCSDPSQAGGTRPATITATPTPTPVTTTPYVTPQGSVGQGQPAVPTNVTLTPTSNCAAGQIAVITWSNNSYTCMTHTQAATYYAQNYGKRVGLVTLGAPNCKRSPAEALAYGSDIGTLDAQGYCY